MTRLGPVLPLVLGALLLGGCGERPVPRWSDVNPVPSRSSTPLPRPATPSYSASLEEVRVLGKGVLYDDAWVVEEGVWDVRAPGKWVAHTGRAFRGQANGLLGAAVDGVMVLVVPGMYGKYRTRVELGGRRPPVPRWCEDVVEAPFRSDGELVMSSFESFSDTWQVEPGTYRVRYCVTGLDAAATEDEFDGDDYHTYTGRHLLQLWPAPIAPDEVVRVGSDWAAERHRAVTG